MAAIAYPYPGRVERGERPALRLVRGGRHNESRLPGRVRPTRAGRLMPLLACLGLVVGVWFAAGALRGAGSPAPLAHLPGATVIGGHQHYVVRPGDTLWSIASRLDPGADPTPIVEELQAELHGAPLRAGRTLILP